jgi:hypothetical protein
MPTLIAFLGREDLRHHPSTPHLRPRLRLPENHRALGYLTDLSILSNESSCTPSLALLRLDHAPPWNRSSGEPPPPYFTSMSSIPRRPALGLCLAPPGHRLARSLVNATAPAPWASPSPVFTSGPPAQLIWFWPEVA